MATCTQSSLQRAAGALLIFCGLLHVVGTAVDVWVPTFFGPVDLQLIPAMRSAPLAVGTWLGSDGIRLWPAHLGFSFATGFGLVFVGLLSLAARGRRLLGLAAILAVCWSVVAGFWFFWAPGLGISAAAFLLVMALSEQRVIERPKSSWSLWEWGVLPTFILGTIHGLALIMELSGPFAFDPQDPALRAALQETGIQVAAMSGSLRSFWGAYLGFNLGLGLGVFGFGLGVVATRRYCPESWPWMAPLITAISLGYATVAAVFWFWPPAIATGITAVCHVWALTQERRQ